MDFDGVIIDIEVVWYEIHKSWFKKNKDYQLSVQEFFTCVGSQEEELLMELEKNYAIGNRSRYTCGLAERAGENSDG